MRMTVKAAAIGLAALGTIGLMSTPASADDVSIQGTDEKINVNDGSDYGGYVKFKHYGDIFVLHRETSRGGAIYLQYDRVDIWGDQKTLVGGVDDEDHVTYNKNLPEGEVYSMRGCVTVGNAPDYCSGYQKFTA